MTDQSRNYDFTFTGPRERENGPRYQGLWAVPGDKRFRTVELSPGSPCWFESAMEAENTAARYLVAYLNKTRED